MKKILSIATIFVALLSMSCNDEDSDPTKNLNLNISGLEDLGSTAIYEGWLIVNGAPVSTGTFSVTATGAMSKTSFAVNASDLEDASTFVLTIEPIPDADPAPSDQHLLGGDFGSTSASLTVAHPAALGNDFMSAAGKYILATPTDGPDTNEASGIWFLDLSSGMPATGLTLPTLPAGWKYEGWAVTGGIPVTTGRFLSVNGADESAPFSGTMMAPPFPGEDFLKNAPSGLTFPTNLAGGMAVISIEPEPDNSPGPFLLKPLLSPIAATAMVHTIYTIGQNLTSLPTGTATR